MDRRKLDLTDKQFVELLKRQLKRIADGVKLDHVDSNQTGSKFTHCSWGLCSEDMETWPDPETWLFEPFRNYAYNEDGELVDVPRPKYRGDHQFCPFDRKDNRSAQDGSFGCFYRCRIFRPKGEKRPNRERAIELYQIRLREVTDDGT